jgi:uracil-DNA glycosylase
MERIPEIIHPSWHEHLQPLFNDRKMLMLRDNILPKCKFYPSGLEIFKVFSMPIDQIRVVILGQDPYFNGSANGLAFAVTLRTPIPASLRIIKEEIINSKVERDTSVNIDSDKWKTLHHWTQQGVFLLNSALTVEVGSAGSHSGQWQWFTRDVISIISKHQRPVWMLWGSKAKSFNSYIFNYHKYDEKTGLIRSPLVNYGLEADHPAAETYPGSKYKFTGCNHFNLCNDLLKKQGKTIINW